MRLEISLKPYCVHKQAVKVGDEADLKAAAFRKQLISCSVNG